MSVLDNFSDWKQFLGERLGSAKEAGMENETVHNVAFQIGDYLAEQVQPKNEQERLLKELWEVGNEEQKRALASMMVKLVQK
ncbi:DUF3243 domain-containing protein [Brevibacillus massiliensis]|jgi:hypothetical protein|uniref:DUF3243 domain-containing protein n=1 Tax=Brevibacillus massiliensis TaxID=1118054 RepID=UPI0002DEE120|nr:DUF3243 domain-containing protein [Brevibacillus massiliensis]